MADVEVLPADLKFRFALSKQLLATITINNKTEQRVAFKIKTTAPKKYVVRPSSGVIEARTSQTVQVIMQAQKEYPTDLSSVKDKFMVQTTPLADEEQIDKDTFNKDVRKDLREARLRVILEGPPAPPSPVPEANELDNGDSATQAEFHSVRVPAADGSRGLGSAAAAAVGAPASAGVDAARLKSDLSSVSSENTSLKVQLEAITKERDDLRKKLDIKDLLGGSPAPTNQPAVDPALKFRVTMVHIILVAIVAFLIGHYT